MNELISSGLQGVSVGVFLSWLGAIVAASVTLYKWLEKYRDLKNTIESYKKTVAKNKSDIEELKKEVALMKEDFKTIKTEEDADFEKLNSKLDCLSRSISEILDYNKVRDRADIKNQIRSLYDTYHTRQSITKNEKETLYDLVSSYENAGGINSFVHTLVVPEIPTWTEID